MQYYISITHTSTLSTLTPHGSVASSSEVCISSEMDSLSDKISERFFVPNTLRREVAASSWVEWLEKQEVVIRTLLQKC